MAVNKTLKDLEAYTEFLDEWQHKFLATPSLDPESDTKKGDDYWHSLEDSLIKVIEEATKLKTKTFV